MGTAIWLLKIYEDDVQSGGLTVTAMVSVLVAVGPAAAVVDGHFVGLKLKEAAAGLV